MLRAARAPVLGKIATDVDVAIRERIRSGIGGSARATRLASGTGWTVSDVLCTCGPDDRTFEEQHTGTSIGIVISGTFQYRSALGRATLTPGSMLLGNHGDCYECGHEHAAGDRCVAIHLSPELFDHIAFDRGVPMTAHRFRVSKLPPMRETSPLVSAAALGLANHRSVAWDELVLKVAAVAIARDNGPKRQGPAPSRRVLAGITEAVRRIERTPQDHVTLTSLASAAGQSPFHYLRIFEQVTGTTPHQFVLRSRLRHAATRLTTEPTRVIEIALETGFNDVSNFNRAFRLEFGVTPTMYRRQAG